MSQTKKRKAELVRAPEEHRESWLMGLDQRTEVARHMRGRWLAVCADLGGEDSMSYAQKSLAERALWLEFVIASQERAIAAGEPIEPGVWTQQLNALAGLWTKLGIQRKPREVQDLTEFLRAMEPGRDG